MKKLFIILVAVLMIGSVAYQVHAHSVAADARTTDGAANVKFEVYNNSGAALDVGDVVVWDVDASTGDNDLYVTTTTTAETGLVAGVVSAAIAAADTGSIIIYGLAECDVDGGVSAPTELCTSGTAGAGKSCATANTGSYAISSSVATGADQIECFVQIR